MPILRGKAQIAIKQEAVAGTFETLAAADALMTVGTPEFEADIAMTPRNGMTGTLSPRGFVPGTQSARIRFAMRMGGSYNHSTGAIAAPTAGTEAPWHVPMLGCGLANTISGSNPNEQNAYIPSDTTISDETSGACVSVGFYLDGKLYKIHGAQGNCRMTFNLGEPVLAEFDFLGCYNAPTDTALLTSVVYPTFVEPPFLGASLSLIGSYTTAKVRSFTFDLGNTLALRPYPNTSTGFYTAQITARNAVGTIDPEEVLAATANFWSQLTTPTLGAITTGTFPSGGTNYNMLNLNVPNAQYTKVALGDRDGIANSAIEFAAVANSAAGLDEHTLTQT